MATTTGRADRVLRSGITYRAVIACRVFVRAASALHTEAVAGDSWPGFDPDDHVAALRAAAQRIIPNRKRMTREDAENILREEFARRGLSPASEALAHYARTFHRGSWWPFLHPRQARREGMRFAWRWSSSEPDWVEDPEGPDDLVAFSETCSAAIRAAIRAVETAMIGRDVPTIEARLMRELRARDVYMNPEGIHLEALRISDPEWGRKDPAALERLVAEISSPAGAQQEAAFGQEWDRVAERLEEALDSMPRLRRCSMSSHRTVDGVTFEIRIDPWSTRRVEKLQRIAAPMHVKVTPY